MDPLSVTASIVALITFAGSILRQLEHVRSRLDAQSELLNIMNTVTDLQATLIVVRDEDDALRNSTTPAVRLAYKALPDTIQKLQKRLDELVDFAHENMLRNGKGLSRLGMSARRKKQLVDIRENISDAHRNLQLVLLSANLSRNHDLLSRIEEAVIVQNQNHAETSTFLSRITAQLTTVHDLQVGSSKSTNYRQDEIKSTLAQSIYDDGNVMSTQIRITTSMPRKACDATCNCQCHVRTRFQTPKILSAAVGTLFYSSTNTPSLYVRPCNVTTCLRAQPPFSSKLTYYFPSWMMRTAVICSTWTSLDGRNSSWFVKMLRQTPSSHPCWDYVYFGEEKKLHQSLERREISPYDVGRGGDSLLHFALLLRRFTTCSLLVAMGAEWSFKGTSGKSAFDVAWRYVLSSKNQTDVIRMRNLVGAEDSYDLCLGPLHRIVTGLSNTDLGIQIDLEPSRIDDRDWLERTPLMWAAARDNPAHLNTLLSRGAQIELNDFDGYRALHLAMEVESLECVRALLEAGADPNSVDGAGNVPFQKFCDWSNFSTVNDVALLLCSHGANLDVQYDIKRMPLGKVVYLGSYEVILALLENGADVNAPNWNGPPIYNAIIYGHDRIVQLLFEFGAATFWNRYDGSMTNVLEIAAECGTVKVMQALTESVIAPIECNLATMTRTFNRRRRRCRCRCRCRCRRRRCICGRRRKVNSTRCLSEEHVAFTCLLEKKAILLDVVEGLDLFAELEKEVVNESDSDETDEDDEYYDYDENGDYDPFRTYYEEYNYYKDNEEEEEEGGGGGGGGDDDDELEDDEDQRGDIFEDALERLSLPDEPDMFASSTVAAS